jgi:hypothetical protein
MINESGNSSIALAESKGNAGAAPEKSGQLRETMVSERSIKFHADGASDGENELDTNTSVSIHIESENPHSANSHNPRATTQTQDSVSPSHDIRTESQEDIRFDTVEEPAPSSVQSVRFQVEESHPASVAASKANRNTSSPPQPTEEEEEEVEQPVTQDGTEGESYLDFHEETPHSAALQHRVTPTLASTQPPAAPAAADAPAAAAPPVEEDVDVEEGEEDVPPTQAKPRNASANSGAVAKETGHSAAPAGAPKDGFATFPPPRRLSSRAATAARTPRTSGVAPVTPRSRTPNSSYRPAHNHSADNVPATAAGVPPLAPADESTQTERQAATAAVAANKPKVFARSATGNSEFSSVADPDANNDDGAAAVASVATPASPNIVITNHCRAFEGAGWTAVVETSRDTIERTVGNETAAAVGVDAQFVRVTSIEADNAGMKCEMSIGHAPTQSTEQLNEAIHNYSYENTLMLLDFVAGHHKSAASESADAEKSAPSIPFSFSEKVGEGLVVLNYSVFPFGSHRHLELSFDGPITEVTIKYVKGCLSEYLGMHESQLVVRRGEEVLSDDATGATLGLVNGCTLEAQCTIPQHQENEDSEDPLQATRQKPVASREDADASMSATSELWQEEAAAVHAKAKVEQPAPQEAESHEEPQQTVPTPEPAPQPKKAAAAKKKAAAPVDKKAKKDEAAATAARTAKKGTSAAKDVPKKAKATAATTTAAAKKSKPKAAAQQKQQPHYATAREAPFVTHSATATHTTAAHSNPSTQQNSVARSQAHKAPLPRVLTTPRVYQAHSPRPGADSLEEGETMAMYMSASRSPSRDGTAARSSRVSGSRRSSTLQPPVTTSNAEPQSVGRRSASAVPPAPSRHAAAIVTTRRSSADSRAYSTSNSVPPQHTVRGVAAVAFRPRPVIEAGQAPKHPQGHPHDFLHNAVERQAETHSASIRSHSPQKPARDVGNDSSESESVDYIEEDVVMVMKEEEGTALEAPVEPQVYAQKEAVVHADVSAAQAAVQRDEADDSAESEESEEVEFVEEPNDAAAASSENMEYDYSGEQHQEEDPVPAAAAPNPFV